MLQKSVMVGALLISNFLVVSAQCAFLQRVPLEERIRSAAFIVEGQVINKTSFWDDRKEMIYTAYEVAVRQILKGLPSTEKVLLVTQGGQVDNIGVDVHPSPGLEVGTLGIYMALVTPRRVLSKTTPSDQPTGYIGPLEVIRYDPTDLVPADPFNRYESAQEVYKGIAEITGERAQWVKELPAFQLPVLHKHAATPIISGLSPSTIAGGADQQLTLTGSNFGTYNASNSKVYFKNVDDGGATYVETPSSLIVSWSNTQIVVKVPAKAGSGTVRVRNNDPTTGTSSAVVYIPYAHANHTHGYTGKITRRRLIDNNSQGGYTFSYSTATEGNGVNFYTHAAKSAFERAANTWKNNTGFNVLSGGSSTLNVKAFDDVNLVRFDNDTNLIGSGILGTASSWYSDFPPLPGDTFDISVVLELDIVFRRSGTGGITWNFGPGATPGSPTQYDFESVALHELGHTHQLNHVINLAQPGMAPQDAGGNHFQTPNMVTSIMYYSILNNTDLRTLYSGDIEGGEAMMDICTPAFEAESRETCMTPANLPISMVSFDASIQEKQIQLSWVTISELQNYGFDVEHKEGNNPDTPFKVIGFVEGSGTTVEQKNYQFNTTGLLPGLHTFRLKQRDLGFGFSYSPPIEIILPGQTPFAVTGLYPNPFTTQATFRMSVQKEQNVHISVFDLLGRKMADLYRDKMLENEIQSFTIDAGSLPSGVYLIRVAGESFGHTFKAVLKK